VQTAEGPACGQIDLDQLATTIRSDTDLISVMLANNEIGVIQPVDQIRSLCRDQPIVIHSDATQAVGKMPLDVRQLDLDLMSFSAHKLYGPKGIGALFICNRSPRLRLVAQIDGGGQERGFRSGTLPVPSIVGFARAVELCQQQMAQESERLAQLRKRLFAALTAAIPGLRLNGPTIEANGQPNPARLPHNLNLRFPNVEGQALMLAIPQLAISSGSACSSASPMPSHVLSALGLDADEVRCSLRFGLGRFNTVDQIDQAVQWLAAAYRTLSP
jgi:cysteine desulfurase